MGGSKRRSGPTAEDPFFKMSDPVPKFTSKKFKKSVDKPEYMSIIVYVRKRYGKYLMKEEETMEIIEMLDNYGFITVDGLEITVADFVGFDDDWSEIYDEEYEALDDDDLDTLYMILEDLEALGYTIHWTHEDI